MSYSNQRRTSVSVVANGFPVVMRGSTGTQATLMVSNSSPFVDRVLKPIIEHVKSAQTGKQTLFEQKLQECMNQNMRFRDTDLRTLSDVPQVEFLDACDMLGVGEYCIVNQISPLDLRQGTLLELRGLSIALGLLAEQPGILLRLFSDTTTNQYGLNSVWLFHQSRWQEVLVDEALAVIGDETAVELAYCRTMQDELWVPLLEKALAKIHHGYAKLTETDVNQILTELTGASCLTFGLLSSHSLKESFLSWDELQAYFVQGNVIYAQTGSNEGTLTQYGFLPNMCYAIIGVSTMECSPGQKEHLVKIRTIWGEPGWTSGRWSPSDPLWSSHKHRLAASYQPCNDGTYCMSFEDFNQAFQSVTVFFVADNCTSASVQLEKTSDTQRDTVVFDVVQEAEYVLTAEQTYSSGSAARHRSQDVKLFSPLKCYLLGVNGKQSAILETTMTIGEKFTVMRANLLPGRFMLIIDTYWIESTEPAQGVTVSLKSMSSVSPPPISKIGLTYPQACDALLQVMRNLSSRYELLFKNFRTIFPTKMFGVSGPPDLRIGGSIASDSSLGFIVYKFTSNGLTDPAATYCLVLESALQGVELISSHKTETGCLLKFSRDTPVEVLLLNIDPRANLGQTFKATLKLSSMIEGAEATKPSFKRVTEFDLNIPSQLKYPNSEFDMRAFLAQIGFKKKSKPVSSRGAAVKLTGKSSRELHMIAEGREAAKNEPCGDCNLV